MLKPLLNQLTSSITGQFRRIERDHGTLRTKLDQSMSAMHQRVWKMKAKEKQDDLSHWHTKEDLRHYLTAMSLLGSNGGGTGGGGGGGRTFGKEKHSFFGGALSHFKDTLEAAREHKRREYSNKLAKAGVQEQSKRGQFLWRAIQGKMGEEVNKEASKTTGGSEEKESTTDGGHPSSATRPGSSALIPASSSSSFAAAAASAASGVDPDLTPEDEAALLRLAREDDDLASVAQGWQVNPADGAFATEAEEMEQAREQLAKLTASMASPSSGARLHPGLVLLRSTHVASGSAHRGVSTLDRKIGAAISAPKVRRKSAEEEEDDEEERQENIKLERQRREEEERKRKADEERESRRSKDRDRDDLQSGRSGVSGSGGSGVGGVVGGNRFSSGGSASSGRRDTGSAASRRASLVSAGGGTAVNGRTTTTAGGSLIGSAGSSAHGSRRASGLANVPSAVAIGGGLKSLLAPAASAASNKRIGGGGTAVAQERAGSATSTIADSTRGGTRVVTAVGMHPPHPRPDVVGLTESEFAREASRVMGMVLANSAALLAASSAAAHKGNADDDNAEEESESAALEAANRFRSAVQSRASQHAAHGPVSSRSLDGDVDLIGGVSAASSARRRADPSFRLQDEIDRLNARTPRTEPGDADTSGGILALAAKKLGVASVDAIGAHGTRGPSAKEAAATSLRYMQSFDLRADQAEIEQLMEKSRAAASRPGTAGGATAMARRESKEDSVLTRDSSGLSPRAKAHRARVRRTAFGSSGTSETTNVASVDHQIDFRVHSPRKDLVALQSVTDPAQVFASLSGVGRVGSTLMTFDQLHAANQLLAEEQRKRVDQASRLAQQADQREATSGAAKQREEKEPEERLRDELAQRSRTRDWATRTGEARAPGRKLVVSSSTGHLRRKAAEEVVAQEAERQRRVQRPAGGGGPAAGGGRTLKVDTGEEKGGAGGRPITPGMTQEEFIASLSPAHYAKSPNSVAAAAAAGGGEFTFAGPSSTVPPAGGLSSSSSSLLSLSGRDYVHLSSALLVPKWTDVARVVDYAALVPGYVPPAPVVPTADLQPIVTIVDGQDEDGFPQHTITTTSGATGDTTVQVVKGHAPTAVLRPRTPIEPNSPTPTSTATAATLPALAGSPTSHTPSNDGAAAAAAAGGGVPPVVPPAVPSSADRARADRRALDARLLSSIDPDVFSTPSARRRELNRLRVEASIPPATHQGPSYFQHQKLAAIKATYQRFVQATVDLAGKKRGTIGAQRIEEISARREETNRRRT